MAKAKYTRGPDGYFKTNVWDGTYKEDGRKHYVPIRSKKSSADLEKKRIAFEESVRDRTNIGSLISPSWLMPGNGRRSIRMGRRTTLGRCTRM